MGQDFNTSWKEFEQASDIPARRTPGPLADRRPKDHGIGANAKIRGIAGELVGGEAELPGGLKVTRRIISDTSESATDYELVAPDGSPAELEVKAQRPESWKGLLDEYDAELKNPTPGKQPSQVARLKKQVEAGRARGRKVYVAISDGTPSDARKRLLATLKRSGIDAEQLLLLQESEIKRVGKQLRDHMGIPQPGGSVSAKGGD